MRVLVTGSRTWTDAQAVADALLNARDNPPARVEVPSRTVVVHGAAKGADLIAAGWADRWGWDVEAHPADWDRHGRTAGYIRNGQMVDSGADVCLAFLDACQGRSCGRRDPHPSHGAIHCLTVAYHRGIPVRRILSPALAALRADR